MSRLLQVSDAQAHYGATQAVFGVDLDVSEGEAVALMGRNGMGKSSTVKVLCRLLRQSAGAVRFDGKPLDRVPPHAAARCGIGLVPEGRRCFPNLTVYENLIAAAPRPLGPRRGHRSVPASGRTAQARRRHALRG